jgi:hypothetical protein
MIIINMNPSPSSSVYEGFIDRASYPFKRAQHIAGRYQSSLSNDYSVEVLFHCTND